MRCSNCNRKNITALLRCNCETWICSKCRIDHETICKFDYITVNKNKLKTELKKSKTTHNFQRLD